MLDSELENSGVDRYIGIKIPAMMHDLGLKNIDIRINDKANIDFREPNKAILDRDRTERKKIRFRSYEKYIDWGIDKDEVNRMVEDSLRTEDYENSREKSFPVISAMAWLISYGVK
jgi:hypothetical protein